MSPEKSGPRPEDAQSFFQSGYWNHLEVRTAYAAAPQPVLRWWSHPTQLNEVDRLMLERISDARVVLDVGAGDGRVGRKFKANGLTGTYLTLDVAAEFEHDFSDLAQVETGSCDAVLCLEVIEHIPLDHFFRFISEILRVVRSGGTVVLATPNAEYVGSIFASDLTHVHAYPAIDLAAILHGHGFACEIVRAAWIRPRAGIKEWIRFNLAKVITRGILQVDYARGVVVIAKHAEGRPLELPAPARR